MWQMHDAGWAWWLVMSIGMVAFWVLFIYGLVWLIRGEGVGRPRTPDERPAKEILERRLAAGEIDVEAYDRLRRVLDDEPAGQPSGDQHAGAAVGRGDP